MFSVFVLWCDQGLRVLLGGLSLFMQHGLICLHHFPESDETGLKCQGLTSAVWAPVFQATTSERSLLPGKETVNKEIP